MAVRATSHRWHLAPSQGNVQGVQPWENVPLFSCFTKALPAGAPSVNDIHKHTLGILHRGTLAVPVPL